MSILLKLNYDALRTKYKLNIQGTCKCLKLICLIRLDVCKSTSDLYFTLPLPLDHKSTVCSVCEALWTWQ